jgi:predicted nucleic acid-binding Zn ribbon protein
MTEYNSAEIYDHPIKHMTVKAIFRYARVEMIPLHDRCHRCGQAIPIGGSWFTKYGAERHCSEICREHGSWSSTQKTYPILSIEHRLTRAFYSIGEAHNCRAGRETVNDRG